MASFFVINQSQQIPCSAILGKDSEIERQIPVDVILIIFSHLQYEHIMSSSLVGRCWRKAKIKMLEYGEGRPEFDIFRKCIDSKINGFSKNSIGLTDEEISKLKLSSIDDFYFSIDIIKREYFQTNRKYSKSGIFVHLVEQLIKRGKIEKALTVASKCSDEISLEIIEKGMKAGKLIQGGKIKDENLNALVACIKAMDPSNGSFALSKVFEKLFKDKEQVQNDRLDTALKLSQVITEEASRSCRGLVFFKIIEQLIEDKELLQNGAVDKVIESAKTNSLFWRLGYVDQYIRELIVKLMQSKKLDEASKLAENLTNYVERDDMFWRISLKLMDNKEFVNATQCANNITSTSQRAIAFEQIISSSIKKDRFGKATECAININIPSERYKAFNRIADHVNAIRYPYVVCKVFRQIIKKLIENCWHPKSIEKIANAMIRNPDIKLRLLSEMYEKYKDFYVFL